MQKMYRNVTSCLMIKEERGDNWQKNEGKKK